MTLASEADFLALIDNHFPNRTAKLDNGLDSVEHGVQLGRGDDCSILNINGLCCFSSDMFLEDVHFRRSYFSPEDIGHKALAVNVSDMAAMGARPLAFGLDLMIPENTNHDFWNRLLAGMAALAAEHELPLTGGDLSRSPLLGLTVHIWGTPGPAGTLLTRGNARPGDLLAVAGSLGLARVGLHWLEKRGVDAIDTFPEATANHLHPQPLVAEGMALAEVPGIRGLMDVSDGLARDLPRFLEASGHVGADLILDNAMLHPEVSAYAAQESSTPQQVAMLGGEDYALLTALDPASRSQALARVPGLTIIGRVTATPGIRLNGAEFHAPGFDHFGG